MKSIHATIYITIFAVLIFFVAQTAMADTDNRRTNTVFASCGVTPGTTADSDGDFICDNWESTANSLIVNYPTGASTSYTYDCGTNALDTRCPAPATDGIRDIFVEIDCISGQCPSDAALIKVREAFWTAKQIRLHIQKSEQTLSEPIPTRFPGTNSAPGFDQIKSVHFGTTTERGVTGWNDNGWKQKQQVFHYAFFTTTQYGNPSSSGIGELFGNDFMVSLGSFSGGVGSEEQQAGTFMHELGHNLNLNHGGDVSTNCKPNYLSVMSYSRQMGDLVPTRDVDYSRLAMGPLTPTTAPNQLSESSVSESGGIDSYASVATPDNDGNPTEEQITWGPQTPAALAWTGSPSVAWDGVSGGPDSYAWNLNNLSGCSGSTSGETLTGYLDWNNIRYDFKSHSNSADGVSADNTAVSGTSCNGAIDSFPESTDCIREFSGGAVNDEVPSAGAQFTITDSGEDMKIRFNQAEITLDDVLSHRELRYNKLKEEVKALAITIDPKYEIAYDNEFSSVNPKDTSDFYKVIRVLNRIKHTMDESIGGKSADDLIPSDMQVQLLPGLESVKMTFQLAAKYEPNDEHPARFGGMSTAMGQEFLGISSDEAVCRPGFTPFLNGQNDRPACIDKDRVDDFSNRPWVTGLVHLSP